MLFTSADWTRASSLGAGAICYRMRTEAGRSASGRQILAVSVCYDAIRSLVYSRAKAWTAPAIVDHDGRVTILAPTPASQVRVIERPAVRLHQAGMHRPIGRTKTAVGT